MVLYAFGVPGLLSFLQGWLALQASFLVRLPLPVLFALALMLPLAQQARTDLADKTDRTDRHKRRMGHAVAFPPFCLLFCF